MDFKVTYLQIGEHLDFLVELANFFQNIYTIDFRYIQIEHDRILFIDLVELQGFLSVRGDIDRVAEFLSPVPGRSLFQLNERRRSAPLPKPKVGWLRYF